MFAHFAKLMWKINSDFLGYGIKLVLGRINLEKGLERNMDEPGRDLGTLKGSCMET